ncbi:protein F [Inovirus sp.]|nr:protein F [Inovirus sp.]
MITVIEIPKIVYGPWEDAYDGRMYYTVMYDGQEKSEDMLVDAYDYLVSSAKAVDTLDQQQPAAAVPEQPAPDPLEVVPVEEDHIGLPEYVTAPEEMEELPFEGSLTAYDDRAADTPALYANLPSVSNSFTNIMDWFGDTFFIERTETVHKSGYTSERYSYNSSTQLIQLPYEEDSTTTSQVLNPQACVSALLVVLVFVTTVTWIKNAIWGRMS